MKNPLKTIKTRESSNFEILKYAKIIQETRSKKCNQIEHLFWLENSEKSLAEKIIFKAKGDKWLTFFVLRNVQR